MAVLNVNLGTFRADFFKIGRIFDYEYVETTPTQVDFYFNDGNVIRRLTGNGFVPDGGGAPELGTVTSLSEIRDGIPRFTISGFAMSWTAFEEFGLANDTGGFLSQVFSGNDSLTGNGRKDVMMGFDGADTLAGGGGNDRIMGGDGADVLDGGTGGDLLIGGLGDDTYIFDSRGDRVIERADGGIDCIESSFSLSLGMHVEDLVLTGTADINGGGNALDNHLTGNIGNNVLNGKRGADIMAGDDGDDLYVVDDASDVVTEAASEGNDTVKSAIDYTLGAHVEHLTLVDRAAAGAGNALDNQIIGNGLANTLDGGDGDDTLRGGGGNDTLAGGDGDDVLDGSRGADCASYAGAVGAVTVDLALSGAQNTGGAGTDTLTRIERLIGGGFGDWLAGNAKSNHIDGGAGADTMTGGTGNDTYMLDDAGDTVIEAEKGGYDVVESSVSHALSAHVERLNLTGTGDIDGTGNAGNNVLKGNDGANVLDGGAGRDRLVGGLGDDTYVVDDRGDTVIEALSGGIDEVKSAVHYTLAATLEHLELTGADDINGTGNALDNRLTGNAGDNRLAAGGGNDTIDGGAGNDTLKGGSGDDLYLISGPLGDHDVIKDYRGLDTLRFEGADPFVEVTLVERIGDDLIFNFQAGGSLTLSRFFRGKPIEILEAWGLPIDLPTDFEGSATLATYLGVNVGTETAGDDVIVGENGADDSIDGLAGDDRIAGVGGDDTLIGNDGDDTLSGGTGDNSLVGGPGADSMLGGTGSDTASYAGSDAGVSVSLAAGTGAGGHAAGDTLSGVEHLVGSDHDDTLIGDGGGNVLDGGDGDDVLIGLAGANSLVGGAGSDTASYAGSNAAVNVDLQTGTPSGGHAAGDTLAGIENLTGSDHDDTLAGDGGGNVLDGGAGDDVLMGNGGADSLAGGDGGDTASYDGSDAAVNVNLQTGIHTGGHAAGDTLDGIENLTGSAHGDTLTGDAGGNALDGGGGDDVLSGGAGADSLLGGDGIDTASYAGSNAGVDVDLDAGAGSGGHAAGDTLSGVENLIGSDHGDTLTGDGGGNVLDGGMGDDVLIGNDGGDSLAGGAGDDTASYRGSDAAVDVNLLAGTAAGGHAEGDVLAGIENLTGSDHGDTLTGDDGGNALDGGAGDDVLIGGLGADALVGGGGNDTASYAGSNVAVVVNLLTNVNSGGHAGGDILGGIENLDGSEYGDTLTGDHGGNVLSGGGGDDWLRGAGGADTLLGGAGSDSASYFGSGAGVNIHLGAGIGIGGHAEGDVLVGIENVLGTLYADTLVGDGGGNVLDGGASDDLLIGGSGSDSLIGGFGNDTASYTGSDAAVDVDLQAGTASGGHAAGDTLGGVENLTGSDHGDTLAGDTGGNSLDGGEGDDVLIGWSGADSLIGGAGEDTASYAGSDAAVNVDLLTGTHGGGHAAGDTLGGVEHLTGSGHGDTLAGDTGDNSIDGGGGDDVLIGWSGADTLVGGDGNDLASYAGSDAAVNVDLLTGTYSGGHAAGDTLSGIENLTGSDHGDILTGDTGGNAIDGGGGNDSLVGGDGDDALVGGSGDDTLAGGLGVDTLTGGADNDRFVFSGALGNQTITDYGAGDRIGFAFGLVAHFAALDTDGSGVLDDADADITIAGGHTVIAVGGGQITVENDTGLGRRGFFLLLIHAGRSPLRYYQRSLITTCDRWH